MSGKVFSWAVATWVTGLIVLVIGLITGSVEVVLMGFVLAIVGVFLAVDNHGRQ